MILATNKKASVTTLGTRPVPLEIFIFTRPGSEWMKLVLGFATASSSATKDFIVAEGFMQLRKLKIYFEPRDCLGICCFPFQRPRQKRRGGGRQTRPLRKEVESKAHAREVM